MIKSLALSATSAVIFGCMTVSASAAAPACQMIQIAELPVVMHGNRPIIESEINGKPARLMVDTGSAATIIWKTAAQGLGIPLRTPSDAIFYGVGGGSQSFKATLSELKLDKTVGHNVQVYVAGEGSRFNGDAGLLGEDFLSQADVEFDFADGKVRLLQPKNCSGDQVVYWNKAYSVLPMMSLSGGRDIVVQADLAGHPVRATMDTGASTSVVTTWTAEQVGVTPQSNGIVRAGQSHGLGAAQVETYEGVFPSFSFGDEMIKNARLRIANLFQADKEVEIGTHIPTSVMDQPRMLLGADFFRAHRVYVARSQNRVYVSYLGGPVFEVPRRDAPPTATPSAPPSGR